MPKQRMRFCLMTKIHSLDRDHILDLCSIVIIAQYFPKGKMISFGTARRLFRLNLHEVQYRWAQAHIICAKHNTVCRKATSFCVRQSGMMLTHRSNDVASKLANDVVSLRTQTQKRASLSTCSFFGAASQI